MQLFIIIEYVLFSSFIVYFHAPFNATVTVKKTTDRNKSNLTTTKKIHTKSKRSDGPTHNVMHLCELSVIFSNNSAAIDN